MTKSTRDKEVELLIASGMVADVLAFENKKHSEAFIILLNDGETYIQLEEQDYYSYHDCSSSARHIRVLKDKSEWERYKSQFFPAYFLT